MTDVGDIHFEFCRAWTNYNSASIIGLGSVPGDTLINFRNYVTNGTPQYCASTQWWDTANPTYGLTSYYLHSLLSSVVDCNNPHRDLLTRGGRLPHAVH